LKAAVTILVFCVAALLALGMVMLYSSSMVPSGTRYLVKQLVWAGVGVASCVAIAGSDYRLLRKLAVPFLVLTAILLALVFHPDIGRAAGGARRWLDFRGVSFQPSELAKISLIIAIAWYAERFQRHMGTWRKGVFIPCIFIGLIVGLVFIEPDRGTAILLAAVSAVMLLVAGVRWVCIVPPSILALAYLGFSLWHDPMRMKRIFSWLDLEESRSGVGYQAYQAMVALGAGGWTGLGLGNGRQKLGFVPEHHTDFIFSIIGEELGLVSTLLVVAAFLAIVICGVIIAFRASDLFGMLLACGVSFLVGLQALINIGVVTSALPNKGLPLPFISYGGSSLVVMLTCVGLLLSVARRARQTESESVQGSPEIRVAQLS
jgi:cell division protein FtsW